MKRVAIQGIRGSYSEEAAQELCGEASVVEFCDFDETFNAIASGLADVAVVPVENKIVGPIQRPAELMAASGYRVLGSLDLQIRHALAGTRDADVAGLSSVRSHAEALRQCGSFLRRQSHLATVVDTDTASSIRRVMADGDPSHGAICSVRAAEIYGATVIQEDVADDLENWTRFYLIGN